MSYEKYIGKKIGVKETEKEFKGKHVGNHKYIYCELEENEPTIKALASEISNLRIWLPGTMGTMDYDLSRTNVHIEKNKEGDYVITEINDG